MKLAGNKAEQYLNDTKDTRPFTLIFGQDESRIRNVIAKKAKLVLGDHAKDELRLEQIEGKDIVKDPSILFDLIATRSFFPGPRGILIYNCLESNFSALKSVCDDWVLDDVYLFLQSGSLKATSKLRNLFEASKDAACIGIYDEVLSNATFSQWVSKHELRITSEAKNALFNFCEGLDQASAHKFLEGISIYQLSDNEVLDIDEILTILPSGYASVVDVTINHIFNGNAKKLLESLRRSPAQGISHHQILSMTIWRLHSLVKVKAATDSNLAMMQMRPPLFGERRTLFENALRKWSLQQLELSLKLLTDTERQIRSGIKLLPEVGLVERNLLKVCFMAR